MIAVMAALLCLLGAGGHILYRCLPPNAKSFFIFNANEDNRLCIDPVLVPRGVAPDIGPFKRTSIIPVYFVVPIGIRHFHTCSYIFIKLQPVIAHCHA